MKGTPWWTAARIRWAALALIAVLCLGGAAIYAFGAYQRYQDRNSGVSAASITDQLPRGRRVVFRNTASGTGYGMVAAVSLDDPGGARSLGDIACDRVDAADGLLSCMRTIRGVPTTFETQVVDSSGRSVEAWALPGVPSRTRVSDNGLVATTSFVTGHSYATNSFSTETTVKSPDGRNYGNLENFTMMVGGRRLTAIDRNVWGVTFAGNNAFYATVASGGKTWLMLGNFDKKTMTSIMQNAECPSVSPDGKSVAYKKRRSGAGAVHWDIGVLDLASKKEMIIPLSDSLDDQLEWLDESTLLYGQPRAGAVGDSDVFSISAAEHAQPRLLIEHAWSPSVER